MNATATKKSPLRKAGAYLQTAKFCTRIKSDNECRDVCVTGLSGPHGGHPLARASLPVSFSADVDLLASAVRALVIAESSWLKLLSISAAAPEVMRGCFEDVALRKAADKGTALHVSYRALSSDGSDDAVVECLLVLGDDIGAHLRQLPAVEGFADEPVDEFDLEDRLQGLMHHSLSASGMHLEVLHRDGETRQHSAWLVSSHDVHDLMLGALLDADEQAASNTLLAADICDCSEVEQ